QYSTPKVIIGAIAAGMRIVQKIWTIRIEKLDEKGTREISGLAHLIRSDAKLRCYFSNRVCAKEGVQPVPVCQEMKNIKY
ncbi:MAG: hypothetical protein P9L92_20190, partial [Candidatus Electryonea clarkiae]|nr:hypothetical protein [Candidatus Electryonea clarkiae]MDP8287965.1 hypothetical protein [Candidatus Electryonea clarkiae]